MMLVNSGLENVARYLDGIVVYSSSWLEHTRRVHQQFKWLEGADLVLNLLKCDIGGAQVTYLGH